MDYLQQKRVNVFDVIPAGFFNYLASNSNQRLYVECLELIYSQYEREISYCTPRNQIRDALAIYLLENHVSLDVDQETGPIKNHGELAPKVIAAYGWHLLTKHFRRCPEKGSSRWCGILKIIIFRSFMRYRLRK